MLRRVRRALSLADSPIGRDISRPTAIVMIVVALLVVAHDLKLLGDFASWGGRRDIPPALALALFVYLNRNQLDAIGVRVRPLPSFRFWLYAALALALIMALLIIGSVIVYLALDKSVMPPPPPRFAFVWGAVVDAPFVEESVYRWIFVSAIVAVMPRRSGPWTAVVLSGAVFAYLHFVYANPGPDNFIGGYFFAWMYLRSGSILVPIAFHAVGNGALIVLNVIGYFALR
jgi:membrane protease YdiL (CAAX protease family)